MLRFILIDQKKRSKIRISFGSKKQKFSQELKKGISLAIFFHLLFLIFFKAIVNENPDEHFPLLIPAQVEVDLGLPVSPEKDSFVILSPQIPKRTPPLPPLPVVETALLHPDLVLLEPDFSELEALRYIPSLTEELL